MTTNIVSFRTQVDDNLASEVTDWLLERGMPIHEARPIVSRTLDTLLPLRGMTLRVKLVPATDPEHPINLSDCLTDGITEALAPLIRVLAYDRAGLELRLWQNGISDPV